ncbi:hypothetical protein B0H63DRAFT_519487 [Podospora didyma]|uniref:Uncharacterized protein n=1 Tax=Podospora didyma TaxID=330526 RepID=A0AAE0NZH8_9PEZI|nr:hypothetical protein B0H63DRAFT_519487 [Podospora didyma]
MPGSDHNTQAKQWPKPSVISAVLDEERLLPTNCMRACTASPTEISYNYSEDPSELYRAEVGFITAEDWCKEPEALFADLIDSNGKVSHDCSNQDSEAGIAYEKIKAVYPKKTMDMIAQSTPQSLADEPAVRRVLRSVKKLRAITASSLYRQLQEYVARIFTKADALSTGACLVDLPGVQDSNAARAAVASNYMKACTGLWIVAPITRGVDDKTAKSLLDDISVTEAAESLHIEEQMDGLWAKIKVKEAEIKAIKSQVAASKDEKEVCDDLMDEISRAWDMWQTPGDKLAVGETVYAPSDSPSKKRKRQVKKSGSRRTRAASDSSDIDVTESDVSDDSDEEDNQSQNDSRQPLTEEDVEERLYLSRSEEKTVREKKKELDRLIKSAKESLKAVIAEKESLDSEVKAICIKGRNRYSRRAIKRDFAMDEASFDPEVGLRDYDAVAESLPVFCVSSRAFQNLSGKMQKDKFSSAGFPTIEDTEIPQLQAHARKLTEAGRAANARLFLNDLVQLINSMTMWTNDDGSRSKMSEGEKETEEQRLQARLQQLEKDLGREVAETVESVNGLLAENIYDSFDKYSPMAATYKATCKRNGVFAGAAGPKDFNVELFEPISKHLAYGWERAFQRILPQTLDGFARSAQLLLEEFHRDATRDVQERGDNYAGEIQRDANRIFTPDIANTMVPAYERCVAESGEPSFPFMLPPCFLPSDCRQPLSPGPGSYMRMKAIMCDHVNNHRQTMFQSATDVVKQQLEEPCRRVGEEMAAEVQNTLTLVAMDYLRVLVGDSAETINSLHRMELMLRAEMSALLASADQRFAPDLLHQPRSPKRSGASDDEHDVPPR